MSFAERNKRWLLPLLGLASAGVLWMNLSGTEAPAKDRAPSVEAPESAAGTDPPPPPTQAGGHDLAAPPPQANDTAPFLLAGHLALSAALRGSPEPPGLHPDQWKNLPNPPPAPPPQVGISLPALKTPPPLEFIIETGSGRQAWLGGRGYRQGDTLEGGFVLKRVTPGGIVLSSPAGMEERTLDGGSRPTPIPREHP